MNNTYFDSIQKIKAAIAKDLEKSGKSKPAPKKNSGKVECIFASVPAALPQW